MARNAPTAPRRPLITALWVSLYAAIVGILALGVAVAVAVASLPSYAELTRRSDLGQMIRVRAANGAVLVSLGPSFGQWLRYDEIPPAMRAAMISVEDKRFRNHIGVDPVGVARSIKVRFDVGRWTQGGSTITQQLARNIFLTNSRTFGRKVKEGVLALAIERKFSKDQILELYLNRVYFGGGAYGIDAASRRFYGHSARELSLGEATIIAGLVKAPSNYSPTADAEAARNRSGVVLKSMVDNGFISAAAAASVDPAKIRLEPTVKQNSVRYFTDWALPQLDTLIDETSEPIDVFTTLDPAMQAAADRAIRANTPSGAQGALVALDRDGAVRAMVGGRDYVDSLYNRATQAERQPGSAFKLFVYLAALEAGMKPTDTLVDEPIDYRRLAAAQFDPHLRRPGYLARSLCAVDQYDQRQDRRATGLFDHRRHGPAVRHQRPDFDLSVDGAGDQRRPADRHDPGLRLGRQSRRVDAALCDPQGRHRRRAIALHA